MKNEDFKMENHDFMKAIIPEVSIIIKKTKVGEIIIKPKLTEKEDFVLDVFSLLQEIHSKIEDLDHSMIFMNSFPAAWKRKMSRESYIIYHLEFYYISIIGIFDRVLHLTNCIYSLDLPDWRVKLNPITSNANIDVKTKEILKKIDKLLGGIRKTQNMIKHKKKFREDKLTEMATYEFVLKNDEHNLSDFRKGLFNLKIQLIYKSYMLDKKKELNNNRRVMESLVNIMLDVLYIQFKKRMKDFDRK